MNKFFAILLALSISLLSMGAFASELRVQKVKTIGDLKHKVIFQSKDLKRVKGTNVITGKIVARWGVHVYEVATAYYECNKNLVCKFFDYETAATYEKCEVKSAVKVECRSRLAGETYSGNSGEIISYENPDEVYDEYGGRRSSYDEYTEFPVRIPGEFDYINF